MRMRTQLKRDEIIDMASRVFLEVGFERASMAEIAARVGGSKGTLYGYFKSKEDLFIEVAQSAAKRQIFPIFEELTRDRHELGKALCTFGEKALAILCSEASVQARRAVIAESGRGDIGKRFFEDGPQRGMEALGTFLQSQMDAGLLRQADPRVAAAHLTALLESETLNPLTFGRQKSMSRKQIRDATERAVGTFLGGYANASKTMSRKS